ncbi:type II secretion system F family protein [Nocardiopsis aegyptia]|uniref:type II secretion system F family protein n=1 Tax=Nocardiopsis aegyptia TaxID=220378 RepID=UPI00366B29B0
MGALAMVLFGSLATWVAMGGGAARRLREVRPPRRAGPPVRPFLLATAAAFAVSVAAAVFGPVGGLIAAGACTALWVRARRGRVRPDRLPVTGELPVVIGLLAAGVRAGATVQGCLPPVARAVGGRLGAELSAVAERLRLGADPEQAWRRSALPAPLAAVGRDLARAADTGAPVADLLDRHVTDLRRVLRARATARVERLGVLVVAPLGLCFLPAFVLIGIVPMAADLLAQALR